MQFVVPQFIDVEDKVLGPISVRQFIIFLVAAGIMFVEVQILRRTAGIVWGIIVAVMTFAFAGALAFVKINGRPFHYFLLSIAQSFKEPRLKVWRKVVLASDLKHERAKPAKSAPSAPPKRLTLSRLAELSLVVDTGGTYHEEGEELVSERSPEV